MALCHREEDDRRTCRVVWGCSNQHVWWKWADRPTAELEVCPYPDLMDGWHPGLTSTTPDEGVHQRLCPAAASVIGRSRSGLGPNS